MKCGSCNIEISKEFKVAIAKNICPACGNAILPSGNLAAFVPLCDLLLSQLPAIMDSRATPSGDAEAAEKMATLIITNFNVSAKSASGSKPEKQSTIEVSEEDDGPSVAIDENGIKYEKFDKKKSQDLIQKMRDEALNGALEDRGIEFSDDEVLLTDDPISNAELLKQHQKQVQAQQAVQGGGGGGFRRST